MSTREVAAARADLVDVERAFRQATGVYQTRREQAKIRLDRALEQERRLREEMDRLVYTLEAGFGVKLGQQTLGPPAEPSGPRLTFIQTTSERELRARIRALRARLAEGPD